MYHAQFGLERNLFGDGIAADAAVFRSPKHDQITAHFKLALGSPNSCVVVRGPAGVGKTTLTSAALRASSTRLALAWLNAAPANAAELLELVLAEFGVGTVGTTRVERLQLWRQFQGEMRATESRLFVVVERTEDFASEVLRALDSLTAPDAAGNLGANVVLLGHAGIDEHLAAPVLEPLRQRIRLRTELAPFTEAEIQDYLRHQVACAGGHYDHVFAPGAVAAVYRHCSGIARLANTLCATALELAASEQQKLLTPELVTKTAVSMLGLAESRPITAAPATSSAPTATVVARPPPAVEEPEAVAPPAPIAFVPPTPPVARAAVAAPAAIPIPAPKPIAAAIPAAAPVLAPPSPAAKAPPAPAPIVEFEFDGGATDITDVAMADFPILTDAVEMPSAPSQRAAAAAPPPDRPAAVEAAAPIPRPTPPKPAPPARLTAPAAATPPAAKPVSPPSRVETAYAAQRTPKPAAAPKAQPAPIRAPAAGSEDDDVLRQTQTMRAIAVAKSIDDISSSMAETLFGDAGIDLVTAALASAAEWPDTDSEPSLPAANAPPPEKAAKPAEPVDDPFDLFGLGDDAPLELIDDSTLPPMGTTRKTAAR